MWTSHGYQIIGTLALDPVSNNRPRVSRCGGPERGCQMCLAEAAEARRDLHTDEFGNIPLLDDTATVDRMLGRIRYALILTRPHAEVDDISERMATIIAEHKVLMEHHGKCDI